MCGFVGIINRSGQSTPSLPLLQTMAEAIAHRGPDDEGYLIEANIGLYHKRLAVIDLASGGQPMTRGNLTIVFNGEIYNYVELRQALKARGCHFETLSDTEVLLAAYEVYGTDCLAQINGMFAFVLYDRGNRQIVSARDHFGIKPLYCYASEAFIVYASEIKALLEHPEIQALPNYQAIEEYITFQYILNEQTFFQGVSKLPPGHLQVIDLESWELQTKRYWTVDFRVDTDHTESYFVHELRQLLENTIDIQMRSDVPVGTYLSGGMDSSLVTLMAASRATRPMKTFTGAFREGTDFNETRYAREVGAQCGADMIEVYPTEQDFIDTLPKLIYHMDEPCAGPGLFPQFMVSRQASQEVTVVLGGQGGDEIFGGYTRFMVAYLEQAIKGSILRSIEEGEHIVTLKSILPNLPSIKKYVPMLKRFWQTGLFEDMDRRYFHLIDRSEGDLTAFSDDLKAQFHHESIFNRFQDQFNHPDTLSYINKMVHFDLSASLPALLHVEDRVSMAVSLESRVPLLDHRIVELVAQMPPAMKFKGAEMKYILKKAAADILPPSILHREDKMGFPVPLHLWARNKAKTFFKDVLLSKACRERGLFHIHELERLIENENAFGRRLWGLLNIELWFQTFIDNQTVRDS